MPPKTIQVKIPHQPQPIDGAITIPSDYTEEKAKNYSLVILTHGAGGDMNNDFLVKFAEALATDGILCLRFTCVSLNLAVRVKAFHAAIKFAQKSYPVQNVILSGRSMGSRAALQASIEAPQDCVGVLFLAYPLHRPDDQSNLRDKPLFDLCKPSLFVSGTSDAMNDLNLLRQTLKKMKHKDDVPPRFHFIDGGDHSFKVKGGKAANEKVTASVLAFCVNWCKQIFGIPTASGTAEEQSDEPLPKLSDKKRKRVSGEDGSLHVAGTDSPTKKSKTLESYFSKPKQHDSN
eukprot:TRINITY_DN14333_c0_g1_i1.p1 TRINITY_DN14333_c0_g1~~TRINITY_DN14333_c0_g1_i1.p1  ORF type:complete len:289 (+),score=45.67 TRINITY_DN14333_c0_g1_i1:23-889(+)